jgi:hypothetical protein
LDFRKNRSGPGLALYAVFVRSDPSLGRSLGVETADRRRIGVRDRNLYAEPTGVKRDDFVDSHSVGMRPHVGLPIELVFVNHPLATVDLRVDAVFQDAAGFGESLDDRVSAAGAPVGPAMVNLTLCLTAYLCCAIAVLQ